MQRKRKNLTSPPDRDVLSADKIICCPVARISTLNPLSFDRPARQRVDPLDSLLLVDGELRGERSVYSVDDHGAAHDRGDEFWMCSHRLLVSSLAASVAFGIRHRTSFWSALANDLEVGGR